MTCDILDDSWDASITHRVKYEDLDGEPLDEWDAYTSEEEALQAYRAAIADPGPDLGGVFVTELTDYDEIVIAAHSFPQSANYRAMSTGTPVSARAALIITGLGGQHLAGFLPGADNKAAISQAVASQHGWSGSAGTWGQVARKGIGLWREVKDREPATAVLFVTWAEVLEVVARGCEGGRREAYEAAYRLFGEWARVSAWVPGETEQQRAEREATVDPTLYARAHDGIHEATAEIIVHGAEQAEEQLKMF
jgi:hypothetical protein